MRERSVLVVPRHAVQGDSMPARRGVIRSATRLTNVTIAVLHTALASFVSLHAYPATQDGPAHLYGVHVLRSLRSGEASPFSGSFIDHLQPVSNSLFSYLALALVRVVPEDWAVRLTSLAALLGLPLSIVAFDRALRGNRGLAKGKDNPFVLVLSSMLAFNYFYYRGFFNFSLAVPLAMGTLAAVVAVGAEPSSAWKSTGFGILGCVLAALTGLAHPAAVVFLLAAVPAACLAPGNARRLVAAAVWIVLAYFCVVSRVHGDGPSSVEFAPPPKALIQFVRALGISCGWIEIVFACSILAFCLVTIWNTLRKGSRELPGSAARFPVWLASFLGIAFFFVPFSYGGAAGLNERIPIFVAALLLPYVPWPGRYAECMSFVFLGFCSYTAAQSVRIDRMAAQVRDSSAATVIPRGSPVVTISLQLKYGGLSADFGRHALGDLARRSELVAGTAFCDHPAHVLHCTSRVPAVPDLSGVQDFEHLNASEQALALEDPNSTIRRSLETMLANGRTARYMLVLHAPALDAAFERFVLGPLHARLLAGHGEMVRSYSLPESQSTVAQQLTP